MNIKTLEQLGFTPGEIKVYLALFDIGESTVGPISKQSGVTHAKVYPILEKLIAKGLVSQISKQGRRYFASTNPNSLLEFVSKKQRKLEEEKTQIKEIVSTLKTKQKSNEEPQQARVFEGFKGLRNLFQELFESKADKEILVFGLNEILANENVTNFMSFYHSVRIKNNIQLKLLLNKDSEKIIKRKHPQSYYKKANIKYLNKDFPTGTFIFADHVISIIVEKNATAFDIKSKQNSETYKKFFNEIWKN